jgi:hypothetical protein
MTILVLALLLLAPHSLSSDQAELKRPADHERCQMELEATFNALADEWEAHRRKTILSSSIWDYLNHPAYKKLVGLGRPAIPYIIERYKKDQLPWGFVLQEITGIQIIKDPNSFSPGEVKKQWIDWWETDQRKTRH